MSANHNQISATLSGRKIAYVSHLDLNLYRFRLSWMKALQQMGCDVHAVVPEGDYSNALQQNGIRTVAYPVARRSLNPLNEIRTIFCLYRIFKRERYDLVHSFTPKPNIYCAIAGTLAGAAVVNHVTGLGYFYTDSGCLARTLRPLLSALYWFSFRCARRVVFQNADDLRELRALVPASKAVLIKGTGVDVEYFSPQTLSAERQREIRRSLNLAADTIVVTLIARLLWHKGVSEFVEAARILTAKYSKVEFLIVGWVDEGNPSAVSAEFVEQAKQVPRLHFVGRRDDVRDILSVTDIYALPSYREGTPRTVLEAMAMFKPVVTTDVPGCRQTVENGVNGFLVPARDVSKLADAIGQLVEDSDLRAKMGLASRQKVEAEFDQRLVIQKVLELYHAVLAQKPPAEPL